MNWWGVDTIVRGGVIHTLDPAAPQVDALAVGRGRILVWLRTDEADRLAGYGVEVVELGGRVALPAFNDAHMHFLEMGRQQMQLDLRDAGSLEEVLERVHREAEQRPEGSWIVGRAWDESKWPERRYPSRHDLDRVSPRHPVALVRVCLHLSVVNSRALEQLEIDLDSPHVELEGGEPTGRLREGAQSAVQRVTAFSEEEWATAFHKATERSLQLGATSQCDWDPRWNLYTRRQWRPGVPGVRLYGGIRIERWAPYRDQGLLDGFGDEWARLGPVKFFADGAFGARNAALRTDFSDDPGNRGILHYDQDQLNGLVLQAHQAGCQVAIHAIGERGIDAALEAIIHAQQSCPRDDPRHRIEHAELIEPEQIRRAVEEGVILSMQPNFIGEWGFPAGMYEHRLGAERYRRCNPLAWVKQAGARCAFGSDGMPFNPMYGIWSAVCAPFEEQRVSLEDALRAYTEGAAFAELAEQHKGTLSPGRQADFIVFDEDPFTIPPEYLGQTKPAATWAAGRQVWP